MMDVLVSSKIICIFQWLCSLHKNYKITHMWNYFETGHGKGEHDGAGACVKTTLQREELKLSTKQSLNRFFNNSSIEGLLNPRSRV